MLQSLAAQVGYYSNLIQKHPGWEYAGVYADEALTGTKDNREEFQRLLTDCRAGKIDMVITKSISRFARNTVTLLETVRELNIAKHLAKSGIPSPSGKIKWPVSTAESILRNEKYKGDAILQKNFTVDFLTKRMKVNEGEVPQYYVENSHPAIIFPEVYDLVQSELKRRKESGRHLSGTGCFAGKIICGECGGIFGSKVWHSTSKYRRTIWRCNQKFDNAQKCQTPHLYEADLEQAFMEAMNSLLENKDALILEFTSIVQGLMDNTALEAEHTKLQDEADVIFGLMHKCVEENARMALDQEDFERRYRSLQERLDSTKQRLRRITEQKPERIARRESIINFLRTLQQSDTCISEFDESLWNALAESVTVYAGKKLVFRLRNGMELPLLV